MSLNQESTFRKFMNQSSANYNLILTALLVTSILVIGILLSVGSPQGEVVSQKLHDQGAVLVRLLIESVELSNGIIECLLGELTSAVR
mmetsp:Transcript_26285/g.59670  ORF Transcript_26285/g.59670 Transcript_26285/m.59670 type:complete len:88 (+) Transcript_26285:673-936(+)